MRSHTVFTVYLLIILPYSINAALETIGKCNDDIGDTMAYNTYDRKFICYHLLPEQLWEGATFTAATRECFGRGGYHLLSFDDEDELKFVKSIYFERLTNNTSAPQYFALGAATYYGSLTWTDDTSTAFLANELWKLGVDYKQDGCYQYMQAEKNYGNFIKVPCNALKSSYVICEREWYLKGDDQDFPLVGQTPSESESIELEGQQQDEDVKAPSAQKEGSPREKEEEPEKQIEIQLLGMCFLLGFTTGTIITVCLLKFSYITKACCGVGSSTRKVEEGRAMNKKEALAKKGETPVNAPQPPEAPEVPGPSAAPPRPDEPPNDSAQAEVVPPPPNDEAA